MNVLFIIIGCAAIFIAAYFTYGKFLSKKVFRLNNENETPAVEINDRQNSVPAKQGMLLGQHFSAIAAVGPINGPILAAVTFGWAPAILWALLGSWQHLCRRCARYGQTASLPCRWCGCGK